MSDNWTVQVRGNYLRMPLSITWSVDSIGPYGCVKLGDGYMWDQFLYFSKEGGIAAHKPHNSSDQVLPTIPIMIFQMIEGGAFQDFPYPEIISLLRELIIEHEHKTKRQQE